ncbi:MAG TPA: hypothetical protein VNM67_25930 [Thermoanaerobaculia bacterium]|jgi:hypothetical protein|nr:hypothetical protein [Thermoanaerobaculia bacterium]
MRNVQSYLEKLVAEAYVISRLFNDLENEDQKDERERRYRRWRKNVVEVLTYAKLDSHLAEIKEILKSAANDANKVQRTTSLLESAVDLLEHGFIGDLKILLRAEMLATTIEQAKVLFEAEHLIPAAVLARIVIEGWLKGEAEKAGVGVPENAKAANINESLKKASIFSVPKWRQVQAYLDIGNAAAHGKAESFTREDIARLLAFAEANYT